MDHETAPTVLSQVSRYPDLVDYAASQRLCPNRSKLGRSIERFAGERLSVAYRKSIFAVIAEVFERPATVTPNGHECGSILRITLQSALRRGGGTVGALREHLDLTHASFAKPVFLGRKNDLPIAYFRADLVHLGATRQPEA